MSAYYDRTKKPYVCTSRLLYKDATISFPCIFLPNRKIKRRGGIYRAILHTSGSPSFYNNYMPSGLTLVPKMMKNMVFMLVAFGVGFVVAEDVQDSAIAVTKAVQYAFPATGDGVTKQQQTCSDEEARQILEGYPDDCRTALLSLTSDLNEIDRLDPNTIERVGDFICQPRCGNPLLDLYEACLQNGRSINAFFRQLCSQNDQGDRCSSAAVISSVSDATAVCPTAISCSSNCQSALQTSTARVGCCINILDVGGLTDFTNFIESSCGITVPGPCEGSTLNGAVAPTMGIFAGTLAVLVAVMFQWLF